jgi:hypothetical protein
LTGYDERMRRGALAQKRRRAVSGSLARWEGRFYVSYVSDRPQDCRLRLEEMRRASDASHDLRAVVRESIHSGQSGTRSWVTSEITLDKRWVMRATKGSR